jgi:glycosyltransferase involved in cell wall biosynthesis
MKILFLTTDLYLNVAGGGQELMRKIIEALPQFSFFYFIDKESDDYNRPINCSVIQFQKLADVKILNQHNLKSINISALKIANQFGRSAKNLEFDIVEIPDYNFFGSFINSTFKYNNIKFKALIINLLGNISSTMEMNWANSSSSQIHEIIELEKKQFLSSDFAYSLSSRYIKEWQSYTKNVIFNLNPLNLINSSKNLEKVTKLNNVKPNLLFLGRFEKRKGPDIFIEICSKIDKKLYDNILMFGDDDFSNNGKSAINHVLQLSNKHDIVIKTYKSVKNKELLELYKGINILILPVRYDTFNLIALDALFSGCLLFASNKAGFCDYVNLNFPNLKYYEFDIENHDELYDKIEDVLENFFHYKNELINTLSKIKIPNTLDIEMSNFYIKSLNSKLKNDLILNEIKYKEVSFSFKYMVVNLLNKYSSKKFYEKVLTVRKNIFKL